MFYKTVIILYTRTEYIFILKIIMIIKIMIIRKVIIKIMNKKKRYILFSFM